MVKQRAARGNRRGNPPAAAPKPEIRNYVDLKTVREKRIKYLERQQELRDALAKKKTTAALEYLFGRILDKSKSIQTKDLILCVCEHSYQYADRQEIKKTLESAGFTVRIGPIWQLEADDDGAYKMDVIGKSIDCNRNKCQGIRVQNTWNTGEEKDLSEISDPEEDLESDLDSEPFEPRC
jgi:hypothetical protein